MNVVTTDETCHFLCRRCRGQWEQRYQIRRWVDRDGDERVASDIAARRDFAPSSGTCCPYCGWCRLLLLQSAPADRGVHYALLSAGHRVGGVLIKPPGPTGTW